MFKRKLQKEKLVLFVSYIGTIEGTLKFVILTFWSRNFTFKF